MGLATELQTALDRVSRIERALAAAASRVGPSAPGPAVHVAVIDTVIEAARLGHLITQLVAEGDLWEDLVLVATVWQRLAGAVRGLEDVGVTLPPGAQEAQQVAAGIGEFVVADRELRVALDALADYPRDPQTRAAVACAAEGVRRAADAMLIAAIEAEGTERLDTALRFTENAEVVARRALVTLRSLG